MPFSLTFGEYQEIFSEEQFKNISFTERCVTVTSPLSVLNQSKEKDLNEYKRIMHLIANGLMARYPDQKIELDGFQNAVFDTLNRQDCIVVSLQYIVDSQTYNEICYLNKEQKVSFVDISDLSFDNDSLPVNPGIFADLSVLMADDDIMVGKMGEAFLVRLGIKKENITIASSRVEAEKFLKAQNFNLIFTDMMMDEENSGELLLNGLRSNYYGDNSDALKVLMSSDDHAENVKGFGGDLFMKKPVNPDTLKKMLKRTLLRKRSLEAVYKRKESLVGCTSISECLYSRGLHGVRNQEMMEKIEELSIAVPPSESSITDGLSEVSSFRFAPVSHRSTGRKGDLSVTPGPSSVRPSSVRPSSVRPSSVTETNISTFQFLSLIPEVSVVEDEESVATETPRPK